MPRGFFDGRFVGRVVSVTLYDSSGYALCIVRTLGGGDLEMWLKVSDIELGG